MTRVMIAAAVLLSACSPDRGWEGFPLEDAGVEADSGSAEDAGHDAAVDGSDDGGADGGEDAGGEDLPWPFWREGDECDLITQQHIDGFVPSQGKSCRREYLGSTGGSTTIADRFGAASFLPTGNMLENSGTGCSPSEGDVDASLRCMGGLFCLPAPGTCHRPCNPEDDDPCPPTALGNAPQECVSTDRYPQPYCRWASHL